MSDHPTREEEPQTTCPICGGVGFVRLDVPVSDPRYGKAVPCICQRRKAAKKRLTRLREVSNLAHLAKQTFDTFVTDAPGSGEVVMALRSAVDACKTFAKHPEGWLLLTGTYGCGKTHLAAAIANERLSQGHPVLFVVVPDLLDHLRAAYAPSSTVSYDTRFEQVRQVELLVLDDLGTQNATPWATEKLYQILNYRYNAELPTVITTNQSIESMDPRLASRLRDKDLVTSLPIYAADFRTMGKNESFGSLNLYADMTFESFSLRQHEIDPKLTTELRQVARHLARLVEDPRPPNWVVLRGPFGVGKTHLAAAAANRVSLSGQKVLFVVVSDLLDHLRATFQPNAPVSYDQLFDQIRRCFFLVLDDMGSQSPTPWAEEKLFQILNYRYVSRLPTVLTIGSADWAGVDDRLKARFENRDVCQVLDIHAPRYEGNQARAKPPRRSTRRRPLDT
ncbi:MAG: ATP-binding protein [Anaerolineae bacterium]